MARKAIPLVIGGVQKFQRLIAESADADAQAVLTGAISRVLRSLRGVRTMGTAKIKGAKPVKGGKGAKGGKPSKKATY